VTADFSANEADLIDQRRDAREDLDDLEPAAAPTTDVEADPADVLEQGRSLPPEEEGWTDA
jgi:hypothetical protein